MTFYDLTGRAVAYTDDNENIYLFSGVPVAYLYGTLVYSYKGNQLGVFDKGWILDRYGCYVFFTEDAGEKGIAKPIKHMKPVKNLKRIKPVKNIRHAPIVRQTDRKSWSNLSGESFFNQ